MLWAILGLSMVVYIYISNAVDNPGVIYGCLHIYPVMLWSILGSSNVVDNPGVIYGCLHIYPAKLRPILGSSMVVNIYIQ